MGKRRIGTHKISCKKPKNKEIVSENSKKKIKTFSFPLIYLDLSGALTASSLISVSLLRPYMLNVMKKKLRSIFKIGVVLNNKNEKKTSKLPFIDIKIEVDKVKVISLFNSQINHF